MGNFRAKIREYLNLWQKLCAILVQENYIDKCF